MRPGPTRPGPARPGADLADLSRAAARQSRQRARAAAASTAGRGPRAGGRRSGRRGRADAQAGDVVGQAGQGRGEERLRVATWPPTPTRAGRLWVTSRTWAGSPRPASRAGATPSSAMRSRSAGTPGSTTTVAPPGAPHPPSTSTATPGVRPGPPASSQGPAGRSARRRIPRSCSAGTAIPWASVHASAPSTLARASGWGTRARPRTSATTSTVTSSGVGPTPPEVRTRRGRGRPSSSASASAMAARSSGTVTTLSRGTAASRRRWAPGAQRACEPALRSRT